MIVKDLPLSRLALLSFEIPLITGISEAISFCSNNGISHTTKEFTSLTFHFVLNSFLESIDKQHTTFKKVLVIHPLLSHSKFAKAVINKHIFDIMIGYPLAWSTVSDWNGNYIESEVQTNLVEAVDQMKLQKFLSKHKLTNLLKKRKVAKRFDSVILHANPLQSEGVTDAQP